ncbi:MAG: hypothetical protein F6K63_01580 [Moorea sp. SIO1G6]|uniref:hypothetical protein n=1 Tax=Moorena sp. SIO1G6 TaxID=2607840 RepID=UPI0013C0556C|nr:hypothetical protein [Moorena sp. SIO1G6]NET63157.1 hypothetical protein [Moorena sp. SIO1G6]
MRQIASAAVGDKSVGGVGSVGRYSQLSYPYSLLPTPLMECGEMKVMCNNLICVHVCPSEVNVFC